MRHEQATLVGREAELQSLRDLLDDGPVVTVTGVGGVGKTRLALAALNGATGGGAAARDGWAVCELAGVDDPSQVAGAVAEALGFPSLDAAAVGLGDRRRVLVLDNCEHHLDAVAHVVERLIAECPDLTILGTSRESLDVDAERTLRLDPLALPGTDDPSDLERSPAVQLFVARAVAAGADMRPDPDRSAAIARLCRRLDGLPLAIELAAARCRSMTPQEILTHFEHNLDLLARRRDRGPARHRSLEAAIDWSYGRLPPQTQAFFDRLAVFTGRFSAETAQAVAGADGEDLLRVVGHLDQLVTQSLVTIQQHGGRSWYGLLDTLRAFVRARLVERGELQTIEGRWVETVADLADRLVRDGARSGSVDGWITVQSVQGDLADGVRWCLDHDVEPDRAVRLFTALWWIAYNARPEPVAELGDRVLLRWPDASSDRLAPVAAITAFAHMVLGRHERGEALAEGVLAGPHSPVAAVVAGRALSVRARSAGRDEDGLRYVDKAMAAARDGALPAWHNELQSVRALVLAGLGRIDEAIEQAGAARDGATALDSPILGAWAGLALGCLVALREPAAGRRLLEPLAEQCLDIEYPLGAGRSLRALGAIELITERPAQAAIRLRHALDVFVDIGHGSQVKATLRWVAALAHATGRSDEGGTLLTATGASPSPLSDVLERAYLDRLLPVRAVPAPAALGLRDGIALARRVLAVPEAVPEVRPTPPTPPASSADGAPTSRFALEGAVWAISFAGQTVRLADAKGLHDLGVLLASPGREVHCGELMGTAVEQDDTGPLLDTQARRSYEARILELQEELAEAEDAYDLGRAERARVELDLLVDELTAAVGLGGRSRSSGGTVERARSAVTWRIRAAIKRIADVHPALGAHLQVAVRTGTWCSYAPADTVTWQA